jgi:hypothetical protein
MADCFGLDGMRGVGRGGGASITGRGSSSAGQPKGEQAVLGRLVVAASMSLEVGDRG